MINTRTQGFTIIEMLLVIVITSLLTAAALNLFMAQSKNIRATEQHNFNSTLADSNFALLSHLLRHAVSGSIDISYNGGNFNNDIATNPEIDNDNIRIEFSLPGGYPIWPNDRAPYDQNWVRLEWSNKQDAAIPYAIAVTTAANKAALENGNTTMLTSETHNALIANLDLWPLDANGNPRNAPTDAANGGYRFQISSRAGKADKLYVNPQLPQDSPFANYRTYFVSGIVTPRN